MKTEITDTCGSGGGGVVIRGLRSGVILSLLALSPILFGDLSAVGPRHAQAAASDETDKPLLAFDARIAGDDARTRVVLDFDGKPTFSVHYVSNPDRVVIDLPATAFGFSPQDLTARGLFKDIRYGAMGEASARLVLTAIRPVKLVMAEVQKNDDHGYRLVLDAEMTTDKAFVEMVRKQVWDTPGDVNAISQAKDDVFTIAIDAGHGGIDAGATGADGKVQEKTITLAFAQALKAKLDGKAGMKAFLTREDDHFLSLSERVTRARQGKADLFISLHADTLREKDIRGATVYTLSDKASDRMAENLAARENLSDQLAGYSLQDGPPEVADILMDLTRRETQAFSISLADRVVSSFEGQVGLINNPRRSAGFQVLRAPDIPSVLLELGFLSNVEDEKLLLDEQWREKVTRLIAEAVLQYRGRAMADGG
ncbi:N-acetylmuramoyl-L-alanine amidase [Neorhizobium huautlense]|uniref:N-acetylmuramoyl-L-alanine amidase n=1 Tax=Neorhizobium huautlense TaxID=67774 RepID=A0ABT9PZ21_9HYPH|nr:N-acetylmuramoyl-L-alanine amidase [Neorhizobium huautlense]MDP9839697.1 N-acetylmuramoyl-L-alanine amidase [Neorhizobium huautlense]